MKNVLFCMLFTLLFACDSPVRNRSPYTTVGTGETPVKVSGDGDANEDDKKNDDDKTNDGDNNQSGDQTTNTDNAGFENCNLGYQYYGARIGNFGLCQNTNFQEKFRIKMATSDSSIGTCFVPIHVNYDGSSYYLGPAQCVNHEAEKVYNMTVTTDINDTINGVMVVKANALNGYLQCMTARTQFINNYVGCSSNPYCLSSANQYAQEVCYNFAQMYDGYYYQLNL